MIVETEPFLEDRAKLIAIAKRVQAAFTRAGYGVEHPSYQLAYDDEHRLTSLTIYSHLGFGGMQDAIITFTASNKCSIYIGFPYNVPPGKRGRDVLSRMCLKKAEIDSQIADLEQTLLVKVRAFLLAES